MSFLFRSLLNGDVRIAELDNLQSNTPRVIFLDGLNEVDGRIAQELIFSLDGYLLRLQ